MQETSFFNDELIALSNRWLMWQCKLMSEVHFGTIFLDDNQSQLKQIALWPEESRLPLERIKEITTEVLQHEHAVIFKESCIAESSSAVCDLFSVPIKNRDQVVGAVSIMLAVRSEEQKKAVLQLLQWGVIWLENILFKVFDEIHKADAALADVAELLTVAEPFPLCMHKVCNVINNRFKGQRVAFGVVKGLRVKLLALSGQLDFNSDSELIRMIELAMEESAEQACMVHYSDQHQLQVVSLQHQKLAELNNHVQLLSLPIAFESSVLGVLFIQKDANFQLTSHEINMLQRIAKLLSLPLLQHKSRKKLFQNSINDSSLSFIEKLVGRDYFKLKIISILLAVSLLGLSIFETERKVYAPSDIVGSVQYQIIAPQAGFIKEASLRAGDLVSKNSPILVLDRKDLLLEKQQLESELLKASRNYQQALATKQRSEVGMAIAEKSLVQAKLDLVSEKIARAVIRSPIDGLMVSGDLSQSLGAPVEKGQQLFEIAPLEGYRVLLKIEEHDIAKVELNQRGVLRLTGLPHEAIEVKLTRITSQSEAWQGANYFRIEADISGGDVKIKPGMQGVTQISVGRASVLSVWTQSTIDRLRLWLWSIGW